MTHNPDVVRRRRARTEAMGLRRVAAEPDAEAIVDPYSWTDPKRYLWLLGLIPAAAVLLAWGLRSLLGIWFSGWAIDWAWWGGPIVVFIIIPLLDYFIGNDGSNPPDEVMAKLEADKYYQWTLYAYIPLQYGSLIAAAYLWGRGDLSVFDSFGLAMTAGVASGIGINTAHELGHKKDQLERWLSKITLAPTWYGHFYVEHNRGHHVRVATPEDPASARWGEPIHLFVFRSFWGSLVHSIELEKKRAARKKRGFWHPDNDVLNAWAMSLVLYAALTAAFGWIVLPYLILQGATGILYLESVNYIEHYGLLRKKLDNGRYERCQPRHSWNADHIVTNVFLYHLQRHSDHHANPTRRYQTLRSFDEAGNLPSGYAAMIAVAMIPPFWRAVMDERVIAQAEGDLERINVRPSKLPQLKKAIAARAA